MKEKIFLNKNDARNHIIDGLIKSMKTSQEKHRTYKKALGEWQESQRIKAQFENRLINYKI
jgi:hypothetical protein